MINGQRCIWPHLKAILMLHFSCWKLAKSSLIQETGKFTISSTSCCTFCLSWDRTPLDDARGERHTSVALLLERRMQELEQAKTIPAGRSLQSAAKSSSMQFLPSQQNGQSAAIHQSPSGGNLKPAEPLEIQTDCINLRQFL